ncbi:MAG: DUF166 family protein [Promethearchaeota archaeon]
MKIGIISDGRYGERAFAVIREIFDTVWILVPDIPTTTIIDDDIELDIPICDLYISYVRHPDIILMLAEMNKPLILGVLPGMGLLHQAQSINPDVVGPRTMCSLEPNTGIKVVDEFAKHFGHPEFELMMDSSSCKVIDVKVKRKSPCGSSIAGAKFIKGKHLDKKNIQEFALSICHECRAPRFGHTCDKEISGLIHVLSLVNAIPKSINGCLKPETRRFLDDLRSEYQKRISNQ